MREILFRGKKKDSGELVYGDLIQLDKESPYWYILPEGISSEMYEDEPYHFRQNDVMCSVALARVIPDTIGQFTGLTDKNGKKIFEGDIVKAKIVYSGLVNVFTKEEIVVVKYIEGCFYPLYDYVKKEIEVIGNIHDNPELLGE